MVPSSQSQLLDLRVAETWPVLDNRANMIGFRIVVNGKRLVTAGLTGHHVVSAILSSVVRDPARKAEWPDPHSFVERELEFSVGGLDSDQKQHVDWLAREVTVGDRIEIQIVDTDKFDAPISRRPKRPPPTPPVQSKAAGRSKTKSVRAPRNTPSKSPASVERSNTSRRKKK